MAPAHFPRVPLIIEFHADCLDDPSRLLFLTPLPHGRETQGADIFVPQWASSDSCSARAQLEEEGFPHAPHEPLPDQPPLRSVSPPGTLAMGWGWVSGFARGAARLNNIRLPTVDIARSDRQGQWPAQPPSCRNKARGKRENTRNQLVATHPRQALPDLAQALGAGSNWMATETVGLLYRARTRKEKQRRNPLSTTVTSRRTQRSCTRLTSVRRPPAQQIAATDRHTSHTWGGGRSVRFGQACTTVHHQPRRLCCPSICL